MKKMILLGALAMLAMGANAQIHMTKQIACHPDDVKHYDTKTLRERFVMEKVMVADEINLTYSMYDRFIFGGAMPVTKELKLEVTQEIRDVFLKQDYFLYNRELGVINCGQGAGVVIVDGVQYPLGPKEALYVGRENKEVSFKSNDPSNPAKFYLNSATAHKKFKNQWITLDGRKNGKVQSLKASVWGPVGTKEEANGRTIYKLIVNDVLEEGPCQLQMGLTQLEPGAVWNTMGEPQESRNVWLHNEQAIMSPEWSIHAAAGTYFYTFIWGMAGENLEYNDKDQVEVIDIR